MQLRLRVDVALHRSTEPHQPPHQQTQLVLNLDGAPYRLDLRCAARLVAAPQLAPLLLPQQGPRGGAAQQQQQQQQQEAGAAGFLTFAQPSAAAAAALPFLTLIFPAACCLNLYPLGWRGGAAAHISKVGDWV